jgi:hypothetical protein
MSRVRHNLKDRGCELFLQSEQDEAENAPGGTAMRPSRHELDCPTCRHGTVVIKWTTAAGYMGRCIDCHLELSQARLEELDYLKGYK